MHETLTPIEAGLYLNLHCRTSLTNQIKSKNMKIEDKINHLKPFVNFSAI